MPSNNPSASLTKETYSPDLLVVRGDNLRSEKVTLVTGQNLQRGAVLGKITVGGKYKLSASAAGDGSQTPNRILAQDCDATAADAEALVYYTGDFNDSQVTLGAGHTVASIREGLRALGIYLLPATA